ncbi:MAG: 2Fe-2S iron-sulfur cluster-binding protein [Planctomycetota bacterium]
MSSTVSAMRFNQRQLQNSREIVLQQIKFAQQKHEAEQKSHTGNWEGFREFYVDRLEKNVEMVTSVYLKPVDGKPIIRFNPGQHLSLRFQISGEPKPVIRCYSLSAGPGKEYYRISVKAVDAPPKQPELPPGKVSNYINQQLMVGDRIEVKAPSGAFFLEEKGESPVILLAGGIGITPVLSMLEHLISIDSQRLIVLFYGVRNSREHAFKDYLQAAASRYSNVHVINCYSNPLDTDVINRDYHVKGFVHIDLMKQVLPTNQCRYYMCGPPPFMESVRNGLLEWGVPEGRINFEAFGPASIKKTAQREQKSMDRQAANATVKFASSNKSLPWEGDFDSILELAESKDVNLPSGCRAGSCGTCATKIISGQVQYPDGMTPECEPGDCLICVAKPKGNVSLDA